VSFRFREGDVIASPNRVKLRLVVEVCEFGSEKRLRRSGNACEQYGQYLLLDLGTQDQCWVDFRNVHGKDFGGYELVGRIEEDQVVTAQK
jgi:hypothetical protein